MFSSPSVQFEAGLYAASGVGAARTRRVEKAKKRNESGEDILEKKRRT